MWPHSEEGSLAGWSCVPMTKRKGQTGSWGQWASLLHRQDPRDRSLSPWPSLQSLGASWWRGGWRGDFAQRFRRAGHSEGSCRHGCFPLARQPVGLERLLCGQGAGASAGSRPDRSPVLDLTFSSGDSGAHSGRIGSSSDRSPSLLSLFPHLGNRGRASWQRLPGGLGS